MDNRSQPGILKVGNSNRSRELRISLGSVCTIRKLSAVRPSRYSRTEVIKPRSGGRPLSVRLRESP